MAAGATLVSAMGHLTDGGRAAAVMGLVAALAVATPVFAADPLACADPRVMQFIRTHLENASPQRSVELTETREVLLGAPPRSANQHATTTTYIAASRYCEGRVDLKPNASEPLYWRIDLVKDGADESPRIDLCHKAFDIFEDDCKAFRPSR